MTPRSLIQEHEAAGRYFSAGGLQSFVRESGSGETVLCFHGVPSSSFLYRKLLPELAERGLRGVAFDLPGLGLADRPVDFDYSFSGLGRWSVAAVDALGLDRYHLVIHDIGGPVGLELAAAHPDRIASLTILNTIIVGIDGFRKPWVMRPFGWPLLGEVHLATMSRFAFTQLMYLLGVNDKARCTPAEAAAYVDMLKRGDRGRAFLKIMRSFETTAEKEALYTSTIKALDVPKQVIWGEDDSALRLARYGSPIQDACGIETLHRLSSKHFLQEDQAPAIAGHIATMIGAT
jgi:pimeloyl-ACP methyl ester carboxylesterase